MFRLGTILRTLGHVLVSGDTTAPGPATIGVPTVTETTATFPHTAPSDSDYSATTIYLLPTGGGSVLTASGSGSTIEVAGLSGSTSYIAVAVAVDTSGNRSTPGAGSVQHLTTLLSATPTYPLFVRWYLNDDADADARGPASIDATRRGSRRVNLGVRARNLRVRITCHAPFDGLELTGLGIKAQTRDSHPHGHRDEDGN